MRTQIYRYKPDAPGQFLILADDDSDSCVLAMSGRFVGDTLTVVVRDADVAVEARKIFAALHEAAGLPVPIVLDRVDEDAFSEWFSVERPTFLGRVLLDPRTPLDFVGARKYAAALIGAVERAENEPDPAEVERLARVIRSSGRTGEDAARAILTRYTLTERKPGGVSDA